MHCPDAYPAVWPHRQFKPPLIGKPGMHLPATRRHHSRRHLKNTKDNIMKTILTLIAAASVAALSSTALAAGTCAKCCKDKCAECCKAKGKTCGKDCCKGE